ncbi:hypothetical protein F4X73_19195 [Candidatus Poribacteria bacterium]|nr:hypothetical protein [Candidatus Poribacteria bacterium]
MSPFLSESRITRISQITRIFESSHAKSRFNPETQTFDGMLGEPDSIIRAIRVIRDNPRFRQICARNFTHPTSIPQTHTILDVVVDDKV